MLGWLNILIGFQKRTLFCNKLHNGNLLDMNSNFGVNSEYSYESNQMASQK